MGILFLFLVLFSMMSLTAYVLDLKIEEALPITNFIIVILLYFSGILFLDLNIGLITLGILNIGFLVKFFKDKKTEKGKVFTESGLIYFCIIFMFAILFPYNRQFISWDEFSHWGLVVKNMYALNHFGNLKEATTSFKGYPPAMSIFQYFFIKLSGSYKENFAFSAMIFFNLSLLSPLFKNIKSKIESVLLSVLIIGFSTIISTDIYTTIYIDLSLGFLSAYILFINLKNEKLNKVDTLNIGMGLFLLPLMKSSGSFLGIMLLSIILFNLLKEQSEIKEKKIKAFIVFISLIVGKYSWDIYTKLTSDFTGAWGGMSNLTFNKVFNFWFLNIGESYQFEVKNNFINALIKNYLTFLGIILILILIYFFFKKSKKVKTSVIGIFLIGVSYVFSLLNLYIYTFSEYEAIRLASFTRYLKTYYIFVAIFLFCLLVNELKQIKLKKIKLFFILICFIGLLGRYKKIKNDFLKNVNRIEFNQNLKKIIDKNDKLYFICQKSSGYEYWVARYEYTPAHMIGSWNWSIGEKYSPSDIWTQNITLNQFEENLRKATYVYLYKIDEKFIRNYGEVFNNNNIKISSGDIFKIENRNEKMEFIKVNNQ
ncbi:MAG: hypothetical protein ACRC6U_07365 [Fusobacteriaceae bacterium]